MLAYAPRAGAHAPVASAGFVAVFLASAFNADAAVDAARASPPATMVFRCEPAAGSDSLVLYTDQPCPTGRALDAQDRRSREQQQQAVARTREEGRWAEAMARQRRQAEGLRASEQQRQPTVIGREKVDISRTARSDALRDAELRRMARPHRQASKAPVPEPHAAGGGTVPKATPGRP